MAFFFVFEGFAGVSGALCICSEGTGDCSPASLAASDSWDALHQMLHEKT